MCVCVGISKKTAGDINETRYSRPLLSGKVAERFARKESGVRRFAGSASLWQRLKIEHLNEGGLFVWRIPRSPYQLHQE